MKFQKAHWIKFKNKLLPKWYPDTWTVYDRKNHGIMFRDFELAVIYEKQLEIIKLLK